MSSLNTQNRASLILLAAALLLFYAFPNTLVKLHALVAREDIAQRDFISHSSGQRVYTDAVIYDALRKQYPTVHLTIVPLGHFESSCDFRAYAAATGLLEVTPAALSSVADQNIKLRVYSPATRRLDAKDGTLDYDVVFAKYVMKWQGREMVMYYVSGRDGEHMTSKTQFVLGHDVVALDALIVAVAKWAEQLHDEVWVFDGGFWGKSQTLYASIQAATWDDVILDPQTKRAIQDDVTRFFSSRKRYADLRVPWKRGVIYHGPPGNGKTVSIKATMNTLHNLAEGVPTLYVRSLRSMDGPEGSLSRIFARARKSAPCLLVFEDLDSLVTDNVRSYFLNEVDGLESNDGVFMIGSTNHLNRLDVAISERPSRFDRKYEFPKPSFDERVAYCDFWRAKLGNDSSVSFPKDLSRDIAGITEDFSFAFLQEAFVASLLSIAGDPEDGIGLEGGTRGNGKKLRLWEALEVQISALRVEVQNGNLASHRRAVVAGQEGDVNIHRRFMGAQKMRAVPVG